MSVGAGREAGERMMKRDRERNRERERERERGLVSLRGVSYRPSLGSAYHEHEPSAPSPPSSLSLSLNSLQSAHDLSHPVFPSKPRRMQTTDANPPANLHLITTITTGDSRDTTSGSSPPPSHPLQWSLPKRTHGIAFRTIGSRSPVQR